jgi:hypothetical protein
MCVAKRPSIFSYRSYLFSKIERNLVSNDGDRLRIKIPSIFATSVRNSWNDFVSSLNNSSKPCPVPEDHRARTPRVVPRRANLRAPSHPSRLADLVSSFLCCFTYCFFCLPSTFPKGRPCRILPFRRTPRGLEDPRPFLCLFHRSPLHGTRCPTSFKASRRSRDIRVIFQTQT